MVASLKIDQDSMKKGTNSLKTALVSIQKRAIFNPSSPFSVSWPLFSQPAWENFKKHPTLLIK